MTAQAQAFWRELYDRWIDLGCSDFDGADIQEMAVRHGLIEEVQYDPDKHGPNDCDMKAGDWGWLVLTEAGKA